MRYLIALAILFAIRAGAQDAAINVAQRERMIIRLLHSQPDSARVHIKAILACKETLPDTVYANANIFYGYTCLLKSNPDSALFYYERAMKYTKGYPGHHAWALRSKAGAYKKKGEYAEAIKLLGIAEEKYASVGKKQDVAIVYGEMASNYNLMLKSDDAIKYLLKAIAILEKSNDKYFILPIKQSLANTYFNASDFEFATDLYDEVLAGFREKKIGKNYYLTLVNYGESFYYLKQYPKAEKALLEAIEGLKKFNDVQLTAVAYSKLAKIKIAQKNNGQAEKYYESAYRMALSSEAPQLVHIASEYLKVLNYMKKYDVAKEVIGAVEASPAVALANVADNMVFAADKALTYQKTNDEKKALESVKDELKLKDTLNRVSDEAVTLNLQKQYQSQYQHKKQKKLSGINTALRGKVEGARKMRLLPVAALTVLFFITFLIVRRKTKINKEKIREAKERLDHMVRHYEEGKDVNRVQKKSIQVKQAELVTGILSLSDIEERIGLVIGNDDVVLKDIREDLGKIVPDKDYWQIFRKRFSEMDIAFQKSMQEQFPLLNKNDLLFCSLLRLKLPYKDIAVLLQVSPGSVIKKKYRLKKKMGIKEQELDRILDGNCHQVTI